MFLLDTNVMSELRHEQPDGGVWDWATAVQEELVFISVITIAEIRSGIERMPLGRRRRDLEAWLGREVVDRFAGRILGIDVPTADACGRLLGERHLDVGIRRIMDFWLAAIAIQHGLTIVTRNEQDFKDLGVRVLNPWSG